MRVTWKDANKDDRVKDNDSFVDQMALMFPLTENSAFITMGSMKDPVELWRWKADQENPQKIQAKGFGTSSNIEDDTLLGQSVWDAGQWQVVLKRKMLPLSENSANFNVGEIQRCSLAIWAGHNEERAGIKSVAMKWISLAIG
jgi:DMSO reductase family type II enzyme heme b subunit